MHLYTQEIIASVLSELDIEAVDGMVSGHEGARILTWRAKTEFRVEHYYTPNTLCRHAHLGNVASFPVPPRTGKVSRKSMYSVVSVFRLPLAPLRGRKLEENIDVEQSRTAVFSAG